MKNKQYLKTLGLYIISIFCIITYFLLSNSESIVKFNQKADNYRIDYGFLFFILTGFVKYGLLLIGISIPIILTFLLLKKKIKHN